MSVSKVSSDSDFRRPALVAGSATLIPIALTVIIALASVYGLFGTGAHHFMMHSMASFPGWSIVLMGGIVVSGLTFVSCFKLAIFCKKRSERALENTISQTHLGSETLPIATNTESRDETLPTETQTIDGDETLHTENFQRQGGNPYHLPKWVFARNGAIGNAHLQHYLETEVHDSKTKDAIILWSFTQKKFQSRGSSADTFVYRPNTRIIHGAEGHWDEILLVDQMGFAVSISEHLENPSSAFTEKAILEVIPCTRYKQKENLLIAETRDGKHLIHQPGVRSCVFTSATMILLDYDVEVNLSQLYETNLENDDALDAFLKKHGYKLEVLNEINSLPKDVLFNLKRNSYIQQVQEKIRLHGALLFSGKTGLGAHEMVVDGIDSEGVMVREPGQGFAIRITLEAFFKTRPILKAAIRSKRNR